MGRRWADARCAHQLARGAVYSLHKTATRAYIARTAREWRIPMQVVAEMRYDLPATFAFHRQKSVRLAGLHPCAAHPYASSSSPHAAAGTTAQVDVSVDLVRLDVAARAAPACQS